MSAFGWTFSWNVKRRSVDDEVAPVLLIFPAPDELRIEIAIALIARLDGMLLFLLHDGLILRGGNVLPLRFVVDERLHALLRFCLCGFGHV